ncbi:glycosyltransferase [Calothrix sp. NIES-4071]|nr:glycosyltransferase [Calothrix sp. NIES-4071]BAZ63919.1 glycosyltransferase [Calothrix sp. NIES-4105]
MRILMVSCGGVAELVPVKYPQRVSQVLAHTDMLIVETPNLIDKSKALLNKDGEVSLIPLGTNPQHFRPLVGQDLAKWRRSVLKISEETIVLLSPRGWAKLYNHEMIFTAYAQAYPHFHKPTCLAFF